MRLPLFQRATSVRSRVCPVSGGFESVTGASDFGVDDDGRVMDVVLVAARGSAYKR